MIENNNMKNAFIKGKPEVQNKDLFLIMHFRDVPIDISKKIFFYMNRKAY